MASSDIVATAFEHSITGGLGGMLALSLLYPLDNLRTRAQVDGVSVVLFLYPHAEQLASVVGRPASARAAAE
jgi:hypothetical protein